MIDIECAKDIMREYIDGYDSNNPRIALKKAHIFRVTDFAELSAPATMVTFGLFVLISMLLVIYKHFRNQREYDSTHLIGEEKRH